MDPFLRKDVDALLKLEVGGDWPVRNKAHGPSDSDLLSQSQGPRTQPGFLRSRTLTEHLLCARRCLRQEHREERDRFAPCSHEFTVKHRY
jgi:hypothetical protein